MTALLQAPVPDDSPNQALRSRQNREAARHKKRPDFGDSGEAER
ncbi:MAG TPA: hypothetical protein VKV15_10455 [Bryobacteraceae bacterium]|nr:hypothetical protein [Bryobacteraceae bacterium]